MIEDLIFKGKSRDEALAKAANFFGVTVEQLQYEELPSDSDDQVSIQLTENPIKPQLRDDNGERARYGLLRSDALPKQPPRQYKRPGSENDEANSPLTNHTVQQDNKRGQQKQRPKDRNTRNGGGKRHFNKGNNKRGGRKPHRDGGRPPRQQSAPQHDPDWKPAELDLSSMSEFERNIYEFVTRLLENMNLQAQAQPSMQDEKLLINIDGPDRNLLLNRKGEPLVAIQYLVNKIFLGQSDDSDSNPPVYVDSHRYRIARDEELHEIAIASAEKVIQTGKEYSLNPMNPYERRQVHIALKGREDVNTVSRGNGYIKRVSIIPAR